MKSISEDNSTNLLRTLLILFCTFFVMMIVAGSLASWISSYFEPGSRNCYLVQSLVQAIFGFIGTAGITAYFVSSHPLSFLGLAEKVSWRPFTGVVIVFLIGLPFLNQLVYYNNLLSLPESLGALEKSMKEMEEINGKITEILLSGSSIWNLVTGILIIGLLTGFAEEMLFRGSLQKALSKDKSIGKWSIWIAAFIFSAVHLQFYGFFPRLLLGAFFGYLLYSSGSLWPGVFAHALNNSLVVVTYWMQQKFSDIPDLQMIGAVKEGFPIWGIISLGCLTIFFTYCYNWFFKGNKV